MSVTQNPEAGAATAPAPDTATTPKGKPGRKPGRKPKGSAVTLPVAKPKAGKVEKTQKYWIGTLDHCPIQNVTVGGITFPRFRGNPVFEDGIPDREIIHGCEIDLTDEQVKRIIDGVSKRVVRVFGTTDEFKHDHRIEEQSAKPRRGAQMLIVDPDTHHLAPNEYYLAGMLYMHRIDAMTASARAAWPPDSMEG